MLVGGVSGSESVGIEFAEEDEGWGTVSVVSNTVLVHVRYYIQVVSYHNIRYGQLVLNLPRPTHRGSRRVVR
eukprot:SAG31_NODE_265_length_18823_cov_5.968863_4_plen_72_part_00